MSHLRGVLGQGFVVEGARGVRVQAEVELVFPAEFETSLRQGIVADLGTGVTFRQVSGVGGDLVGDDAGFHVVLVGQAQVFFRGDIAEHGAAVPADHCRADTGSNVIIAGGNVRGQWPEGVERCLITAFKLLVHVFLDQLHGHMPRTFDHHLDIVLPGNLGELTQGFQLAKLGFIVGIGDGTGTQSVAKAEGYVVGLHDFADVFEVLVQEAFLVVGQAPFGHDGAATGHNAGGTLGRHRHMMQAHASVDGEVVDALLCLFNQRVTENLPGQVFGSAADFFQRLIDGHGADGNRRVADNPFTGFMDILAGRQIHDGVGTPASAPGELLDLFLDGRTDRRVADVAVDFYQEVATDDHRFGFRVIDIVGNNRPAAGNFVPDKFRRNFLRQGRAEGLARVLILQ